MKSIDQLFATESDESLAVRIITALSEQDIPIRFWNLMNESGLTRMRLIAYESVLHRLRAAGYLTINHDGKNLDSYHPLSVYDLVSITQEGKSFFEKNYQVAK